MSFPLNPAQREAVRYLDGPCLVLAGAGSGKTRVITAKIAHLVQSGQMKAENIGAITFTNKAAGEMAERVRALIGKDAADKATICTFHSLGMRMLRQEARHVGLKPNFTILDAADSAAVISDALATTDKQLIRATQSQISLWKNATLSPGQAADAAANEAQHQIAKVYARYNETVRAYQAVDFDDLISLPLKLLEEHDDVRERWQNKLRYLLVDEVQDTNAAQYALLKYITGPRAMFTAVGDDDQSIYGWRGATLDNLADLQKAYPKLKVIKLEQNYRSTNRILQAANQLISHNPKLFDKKLWSEHGMGDPIAVLPQENEEAEAEAVLARMSAHKFTHRTRHADYAILYRSNMQARIFETALRQQKIPYLISGGQSFFDRAEIKDLVAYLRLIANEDDDQAFMRAVTTPKRGIGPVTLQALGSYSGERHCSMFTAIFETGFASRAKDNQLAPLREFGDFINRLQYRAGKDQGDKKGENAGALLNELVRAIGYEAYLYDAFDAKQALSKWNNVTEFVTWLTRKGDDDGLSLLDLAQHVALITMLQESDAEQDAVRLSTLHAAKGLEFPHVFLVGVEEGLLPHQGRDEKESDDMAARAGKIEEERRLMYVGVTRAQKSLTITPCQKRRRAKDFVARSPSRFLTELGVSKEESAKAQMPQDTKAHMAALKGLLGKRDAAAP
ncbi:MAG: UvrD-helicase domain-containing protein [Burkholderiaceae bacterium]